MLRGDSRCPLGVLPETLLPHLSLEHRYTLGQPSRVKDSPRAASSARGSRRGAAVSTRLARLLPSLHAISARDAVLGSTENCARREAHRMCALQASVRHGYTARAKQHTPLAPGTSRPRTPRSGTFRSAPSAREHQPGGSTGTRRLRPLWSARPVPMHSRHTIHLPFSAGVAPSLVHHVHPAPLHAEHRSFSSILLSL